MVRGRLCREGGEGDRWKARGENSLKVLTFVGGRVLHASPRQIGMLLPLVVRKIGEKINKIDFFLKNTQQYLMRIKMIRFLDQP